MTPEELREAVARAMYEVWRKQIRAEELDTMPPDMLAEVAPKWSKLPDGSKGSWLTQADAAIALVIEEAAKVADNGGNDRWIAAAIRAMLKE